LAAFFRRGTNYEHRAFIFFAMLFFLSAVRNALLPRVTRISAVLAVPPEAGNQLPRAWLQENKSRSFPIFFANAPLLQWLL
jgi:hypothetical protein